EAIEAGLRQPVRTDGRARAARCRALPAHQKAELAEVGAGGEGVQELPSLEDVHLTRADRVESIGRIALLHDGLTRRVLHPFTVLQQLGKLIRLEVLERLQLTQLADLLDGWRELRHFRHIREQPLERASVDLE